MILSRERGSGWIAEVRSQIAEVALSFPALGFRRLGFRVSLPREDGLAGVHEGRRPKR